MSNFSSYRIVQNSTQTHEHERAKDALVRAITTRKALFEKSDATRRLPVASRRPEQK